MESYRLTLFKRKVHRNLSRLERSIDKDKDKLTKTKAIHALIHNLIEGYTKHPRCGLIWDMELALESISL
tara:strand:+ start:358 stop:567 length:210 start_codon:yes stop_codon:yes gene_type:complete